MISELLGFLTDFERLLLSLGIAKIALSALLLAFSIGTGYFVNRKINSAKVSDPKLLKTTIGLLIGILTLLALLLIWNVGGDVAALIAGGISIIITVIARKTIGSLISGLSLYYSKPYTIGDWVKIQDIEGIVTKLNLINTSIESFDGENITIPNSLISNDIIVNKTDKGRLAQIVEVSIENQTPPEEITKIAEEEMMEIDSILKVPRPRANLSDFDSDEMTVDLKFWIDMPSKRRRERAQDQVLSKVLERFEQEDIN